MKYISVLLLVLSIILLSLSIDVYADNGQPGCKTEDEIVVKKYRNNWDPTRYWLCLLRGQPAASVNCEPEFMFQDELKKCVHYSEWVWTAPTNPPSRP